MLVNAEYSSVEPFHGGGTIEFRALRPDDKADMLAAVERTSMQSRQRRFLRRNADSRTARSRSS